MEKLMEVPTLKTEAELALALVNIANLCFWFTHSDTIKRDLAARKDLDGKGGLHA